MIDHANGTTFAYTQREAELETSEERQGLRPHPRMPARVTNGGFHPLPMATLTPEQATAAAWSLYGALMDLHNVLAERGQITDAVMVNVWGRARAVVRHAATRKDTSDGVALNVETDEAKKAQAAGANPADGSGAEAGDGQHPPQQTPAQTKVTPVG